VKKKPLNLFHPWMPGEHVSLIGLTGSGKSTLGSRLLEDRQFVLILRTKADDVKYPHTVKITKAEQLKDPRVERFVLEPYPDQAIQRKEISRALDMVWQMGGFTVYVDETLYVDNELGCRPLLNRLLTQGRNPGKISVICAMQRPVQVTRFAIGESTHVICFGLEGRDAKIVGETTSPRLAKAVTQLSRHAFCHYYVPTREIFAGRLNLSTGQIQGEVLEKIA
jgi:hypothetical protein